MSTGVTIYPVEPQPVRINDDFDGTWEWIDRGDYYDDLTMAWKLMANSPFQVGQKQEGKTISDCNIRLSSWLSPEEAAHKPKINADWWWLVTLED